MVEMPFEVVPDLGAQGFFDCVRLAPHFAQDDREEECWLI